MGNPQQVKVYSWEKTYIYIYLYLYIFIYIYIYISLSLFKWWLFQQAPELHHIKDAGSMLKCTYIEKLG